MKLIFLQDEDICNYKKTSMFIGFSTCSMKCGKEKCQNAALLKEPLLDIEIKDLVQRYINNPLTSAIVCGGLEPMDSWEDLCKLIIELRRYTNDPIVIYTGYTQEEIEIKYIKSLVYFKNIVVKYGRYIPNNEPHYDPVLGVNLVSNNQYAIQYNWEG